MNFKSVGRPIGVTILFFISIFMYKTLYAEDWNYQILVETADNTVSVDSYNFFGFDTNATEGFDAMLEDVEAPLPPGEYVNLYFDRPDWTHPLGGDKFTSDIRPHMDLEADVSIFEFSVLSSSDRQVNLIFIPNNVPEWMPATMEKDTDILLEFSGDTAFYSFQALANTVHDFIIVLGDTSAPEILFGEDFSGPHIFISNETHTFSWEILSPFDSLFISISPDNGASYTEIAALADSAYEFNWLVPDTSILLDGLFKARAVDKRYELEYWGQVNVGIVNKTQNVHFPSGWNLWGPALLPDISNSDSLLGLQLNDYWVNYMFEDSQYQESNVIQFTNAYWLGLEFDVDLELSGTVATTEIQSDLQNGWNLISTPLVYPIPIDSLDFMLGSENLNYIEAVNAGWVNALFAYEDSVYIVPEKLEWWKGYWLAVLMENVKINYPLMAPFQASKSSQKSENGFDIALSVQSKDQKESITVIGSKDGASDGFDAFYDQVYPPLPPAEDYVSIAVLQPEMELITGDYLSRDFRNNANTEHTWSLLIRSTIDELTLSWTKSDFPANLDLVLTRENGNKYNMLDMDAITLSANEQITIMTGMDITSVNDILLPKTCYLKQNYPNP
ncbi:hypothetical protein KAJ27_09235, partial [bacterium]|nr:hypothetical protein [bacterium]